MNEEELNVFKERLQKLSHTGTESAVRAYVDEQFPRLPKAMQDEIIDGLYLTGLCAEVAELREALQAGEDEPETSAQ